jgi:hypothetical protein
LERLELLSQLAIWFQLVKIWFHHFPRERAQQLAGGHTRHLGLESNPSIPAEDSR